MSENKDWTNRKAPVQMVPIARVDELDDHATRGVDIDGQAFIVVRKNTEIFVYRNHCPHRGSRLEWQPDRFLDSSGELIQCKTHGALFIIETGACIAGPCHGSALECINTHNVNDYIFIALNSAD